MYFVESNSSPFAGLCILKSFTLTHFSHPRCLALCYTRRLTPPWHKTAASYCCCIACVKNWRNLAKGEWHAIVCSAKTSNIRRVSPWRQFICHSFCVKFPPPLSITCHECRHRRRVEVEYISTLSLTSAMDESGWLTPRPFRLNPPENDPIPFVQAAGWTLGSVWTCAGNLSAGFDPRTVHSVASRYTEQLLWDKITIWHFFDLAS